MALRILSGAGAASFVAYRLDAERAFELMVHGLTTTGELVVAANAAADLPGLSTGSVDVRLDIRRDAAEADVRVLAATTHLLGTIHWQTGSEDAGIENGSLPDRLEMLDAMPGVVLGVVRSERVLLHDMSGVTSFQLRALTARRSAGRVFPCAEEELDAQDVVRALGQSSLAELHRAVIDGHCAGQVLNTRPDSRGPECMVGRVVCVDVDGTGITLLRVGLGEMTTVVAAFPARVGDITHLRRQVDALAPQNSVLTRYPRT